VNPVRYEDVRQPTEGLSTLIGTTTQNVTDADVVVAMKKDYQPVSSKLVSALANPEQSLVDFLSKPIRISTGEFQTTDSGTTFGMFAVLTGILNNPIYAEKTRGFLGIKADVVLRLQCNANPFQQGRYVLAFIPTMGTNPNSPIAGGYLLAHRFGMQQTSQLPHVELDINCDTECILRIPFSSAETMFSLRSASSMDGHTDIGVAFMRPYVALSSVAGSTTASYTLWAHLENVELFGPTIPQMAGGTLSEIELKKSGLGPISGPLTKVSKAATIISEIPLLSDFASLTAFFADVGARAASAFGFSKPLTQQPITRMLRTTFPSAVNVDGVSHGVNLAYSEKNQLELMPGFAGSKFDEMSIDYIKSIPGYYKNVVWTTAHTADTVLYNAGMCPMEFTSQPSDNGVLLTNFTPVAWLGTIFGVFRGSFVLRLKFVKTCFHSGRIMVTFIPIDHRFPIPTLTDVSLYPYANRTIIDIREGNEATIGIPYTNNMNYLPVDQPYGYVILSVVDPLKAPATVSSSINILFEAFGGSDIEFAQPKRLEWGPYWPTAAQMGDPCELDYSTIGGASITPSDIFARSCIGEKILSLRSLIKGFVPIPNFDHSVPVGNVYEFNPYAVLVFKNAGPAQTTNPTQRIDYFSYIGSVFAAMRGSVMFYGDAAADVKWVARLQHEELTQPNTIYTGSTIFPADGRSLINSQPVAHGNTAIEGAIMLSVPYYNHYHSIPIADAVFHTTPLPVNRDHMPPGLVTVVTNTSTNVTFSRACGDDFSFGGFVSVPPMRRYTN
jgi:hypothetical protein